MGKDVERHCDGSPVYSDAGLIHKAASLKALEVNDSELAKINKFTLSPLGADDVFTFSAILCDNEVDRQYDAFSLNALREMKKMFVGRTVVKDHDWTADNQVARIYDTELVTGEKLLANGEAYTQLKAHCYMVRTEGNKDLIAEIQGGIKKEGSVSFRAASSICSICGTDNAKSYCSHWPGRSYEKEGGSQVCTFRLDKIKEAYEFSLVAVPAQKAAGVSKCYNGHEEFAPDEESETESVEKALEPNNEAELVQRLKLRARL